MSGDVLTFDLTVSDGQASTSDTMQVTVENVNHSPTANAGPDQNVAEGVIVALNGTGSSDPDGDALMYQWLQIGGGAVVISNGNTPTASVVAPMVGNGIELLEFELTVCDTSGACSADQISIWVRDQNAPPSCSLAKPSQSILWPPNHKMVSISIHGLTDPEDDSVTVTITGVTQDEPINGQGDGDTAPDAVILGDKVLLRAERSGGGNGRVYRVEFTADDGSGGTCWGSVIVCVPYDRKKPHECTDDGQIYVSTGQ
jgi:hypothetical protein